MQVFCVKSAQDVWLYFRRINNVKCEGEKKMLKKKYISLLFIALVAVMLLAGNKVMAADEAPTSCILVDANGNVSPYSLSVLSDPATGTWPIPVNGTNQYLWAYAIGGSLSGINQLDALEPVCSPDLGYSITSGGQVIAPGAGDPTTTFGLGNYQDYVIRLAYSAGTQGLPANYNFLTTKSGSFQKSSMQIKVGKSIYYCQNIVGPACAILPQRAFTTSRTIHTADANGNPDVYFVLNADPSTGCETPDPKVGCNGSPCNQIALSALQLIGHEGTANPIDYMATPGSACVNFIMKDNSSGSTYHCSAGRCYYY
jgi:hypothetical protein